MRTIIFTLTSLVLLVSCAPTKTLYSWNNYEITSYNYLKNSDEKAIQELIKTYKQIIGKQTGTRRVVPPGIYADYGFVLMQANRTNEAKTFLLKEVELYPESKQFIEKILKMIEE